MLTDPSSLSCCCYFSLLLLCLFWYKLKPDLNEIFFKKYLSLIQSASEATLLLFFKYFKALVALAERWHINAIIQQK